MTTFLWDASALAKRYVGEQGTPTVNTLFAASSAHIGTLTGYAETYSILLRRLRDKRLSTVLWREAASALEHDVWRNADFSLLFITESDILTSFTLMRRHALNSTDAAILQSFLRYARSVRAAAPAEKHVLIASDTRLLRAAQAEGLDTFNPETATPDDAAGL